jgi:hypothetical protein
MSGGPRPSETALKKTLKKVKKGVDKRKRV